MDNFLILFRTLLANINLITGNNGSTREICSKLTIKTPERRLWRLWRRSGFFILNFEHILHLFLVFLLLTYFSEFSQLKARNFIKNCILGILRKFHNSFIRNTYRVSPWTAGILFGLFWIHFVGWTRIVAPNIKNNLS